MIVKTEPEERQGRGLTNDCHRNIMHKQYFAMTQTRLIEP